MSHYPVPILPMYGGFGFGFGRPAVTDDQPLPEEAKAQSQEPIDRASNTLSPYGGVYGSWGAFPGFDLAPPPSLWVWWQMRQYPTIVLAHTITTAPALASPLTVEIADDQGNPELAAERKMQGQKALLPGLMDAFPASMEALHFGCWLQEVIWEQGVDGTLDPVRFNSLLPGEAVLHQDHTRKFTGYQVGKDFRDARYGFLAVNEPHIDPIFGYSRNQNCREEWWRIRQSNLNADKMEKKAAGIQMMLGLPIGKTFTDKNGVPLMPDAVAQTIINAAVQGQVFTVPLWPFDKDAIMARPELAKVSAVTAQAFDWGDIGPAVMAHLHRIERLNTDIIRAWHRPEREATEGHHGTKAEAQAHGQVGITDSERVGNQFIRQFNQQITDRWLVTNFGPKAKGTLVVQMAPLSDPQQQYLQEVTKSLIVDTATGPDLQANVDNRALLDATGVPMVSKEEADKAIAEQQQQKQANAQQMQASSGNAEPPMSGNGKPKQNGDRLKLDASGAKAVHSAAMLSRWLGLQEEDEENAVALSLAADDGDGVWRTINGAHVLIKNGVVVKGPKRLIGKTHAQAKAHRQSEKSARAAANVKVVKADIQQYSEEKNEPVLANGLKDANRNQNAMSLRDNEPVDAVVVRDGKIEHGVELKTMVDNGNNKITMKESALARKRQWVKDNKATFHTVVFDDQKVFNAGGEGIHGPASARSIFYKRGAGSFRVGSMHRVKNMNELRSLIDMPDEKLPTAAKASAKWTSKL